MLGFEFCHFHKEDGNHGQEIFCGGAGRVCAIEAYLCHGRGGNHPQAGDERETVLRWEKKFAGLGVAEPRPIPAANSRIASTHAQFTVDLLFSSKRDIFISSGPHVKVRG